MKIRYILPVSENPYMVNYYQDMYYDVVNEVYHEVDLIVDRKRYYEVLTKNPLGGGTKEEHTIFKDLYNNAISLYTVKISLPFLSIKGINGTGTFCVRSKEDIQKEYGIIDKLSFRTTVNFIDEHFDYLEYTRDIILNDLLK